MEPIISQWYEDDEFRALPPEERKRIVSKYFDEQTGNDNEFKLLPIGEQYQIRSNFIQENYQDISPSLIDNFTELNKNIYQNLSADVAKIPGILKDKAKVKLSDLPEYLASPMTPLMGPTTAMDAAIEAFTGKPDVTKKASTDIAKFLGTGVLQAGELLNAPARIGMKAAATQFQNADDPEWQKKSWLEKQLASTGQGILSSINAVRDPMNAGSAYDEMFRAIAGKGVTESLPESLQFLGPTLQMAGDVALDPTMFVLGPTAAMRRGEQLPTSVMNKMVARGEKAVPTEQVNKIVQDIIALARDEALDEQARMAAGHQLVNLLKTRAEEIDPGIIENARQTIKDLGGDPDQLLLPPGQGFTVSDYPNFPLVKSDAIRQGYTPESSAFSPEISRMINQRALPGPERDMPLFLPDGYGGFEMIPTTKRRPGSAQLTKEKLATQKEPQVLRKGLKKYEGKVFDEAQEYFISLSQEQLQGAIQILKKQPKNNKPLIEIAEEVLAAKQRPVYEMEIDVPVGPQPSKLDQDIENMIDQRQESLKKKDSAPVTKQVPNAPEPPMAQSLPEEGFPPTAQPSGDINQKITDAYNALKSERKFSDVMISDLAERSGVPVQDVQNYVLQRAKSGTAIPSRGDWSLANDVEKSAGIKLRPDQDPYMMVRFKDGGAPGGQSVMGGMAGVQEDEEGNFKIDPLTAAAGIAAAGAGVYGINKYRKSKAAKAHAAELANMPATAKIASTIAKGDEVSREMTAFHKTMRDYFDRYEATRVLPDKTTYQAQRQFKSYIDVMDYQIKDLERGINNKATRKNSELFVEYVTAHRNMTRAERGFSNPGGVTLDEARASIAEIEARLQQKGYDPQQFKTAMDNWKVWTEDMVMEMNASGLLSDEAANAILNNNEWYATYRYMDLIDKEPIIFNKGAERFSKGSQTVVKSLKGAPEKIMVRDPATGQMVEKLADEIQIADPLTSTVDKFYKAISASEQNRVARTLIESPEAANMGLVRIAKSQEEQAMLKQQGIDSILEGTLTSSKDYGTINAFIDGKVQSYAVPKDIVESMEQLSAPMAHKWVRLWNGMFRQAATSTYIPFIIRNSFRDAKMAFDLSPTNKWYHGYRRIPGASAQWWEGFGRALKYSYTKNDRIMREYFGSGGGMGYAGTMMAEAKSQGAASQQLLQSTTRRVAAQFNPLKHVEALSNAIEMAPRIGVYQQAKKLGYTNKDAAFLARSITIDFNRAGIKSRIYNQYVPFLNARIQGRVAMVEALADPKRRKGTIAKIVTNTILPGMGIYAANRLYNSDLYDDIDPRIRENNYCIITGTAQDEYGKTVPKYITIPKGDADQIIWNPVEQALEQMYSDNPKDTFGFLVDFISDILPVDISRDGEISATAFLASTLPPMAKAAIEPTANYQFYYGRNIESPYWQQGPGYLPPELRSYKSTPEIYKDISKWMAKTPVLNKLELGPTKLQNIMGNLFAGYGRNPEMLWNPLKVYEKTGETLVTARGGYKLQRINQLDEEITKASASIRAFAEESIKMGEPRAALEIVRAWHREKLPEMIQNMEKLGAEKWYINQLMKDARISPNEFKNIIKGRAIEPVKESIPLPYRKRITEKQFKRMAR